MTVPVGGFVPACTACNTTIWPACAAPLDVRASYPPAWNFHWTLCAPSNRISQQADTANIPPCPARLAHDHLQGNCRVCKGALGDPTDFLPPFRREFAVG